MHDLAKHLYPPLVKGGEYDQADLSFRDKGISDYDILVATKDGLPKSIQYEM